MEDKIVSGSVKTSPNVSPAGFAVDNETYLSTHEELHTAMSLLTRKIVSEQPKDILLFAMDFFEQIKLRLESGEKSILSK